MRISSEGERTLWEKTTCIFRHSKKWVQTGASLYGSNKARSASSMAKSMQGKGKSTKCSTGYGGHFRAVQAFKYIGEYDHQDIRK